MLPSRGLALSHADGQRLHSSSIAASGKKHLKRVPPQSRSCSNPIPPPAHAFSPIKLNKLSQSRWSQICRNSDYVANVSDEGVLKLPARVELDPDEITHVFGYPRDFEDQFYMGKVLGCGSFGVVRECLERSSGKRFAVKTIDKFLKRGPPTPRYLLKLRSEVEIMQQIGFSLDAVNLKGVFEDDESIHLVMQLCEGGALLERIEKRTEAYRQLGLIRPVMCGQANFGRIYPPDREDSLGSSDQWCMAKPKSVALSGLPGSLLRKRKLSGLMSRENVLREEKCERKSCVTCVGGSILSDDINWDAQELEGLSPGAINFLQQLLQRDPDVRPSAADALDHPWVREDGEAFDLPLQGSVVQGSVLQDAVGGISMAELSEGLRQQGYILTDQEIELLGNKMDFDKNDNIDVTEFMTTLVDWSTVQRSNKWQAYLDIANHMQGQGDELENLVVNVQGSSLSEDGIDAGILEQVSGGATETKPDTCDLNELENLVVNVQGSSLSEVGIDASILEAGGSSLSEVGIDASILEQLENLVVNVQGSSLSEVGIDASILEQRSLNVRPNELEKLVVTVQGSSPRRVGAMPAFLIM
eukprot:gene18146-24586_t